LKPSLQLFALPGLPMVRAGDDLPPLLEDAMTRAGLMPEPGDVLAVAQKIVSKAEGRSIALASVQPSQAARDLAEQTGKDARLVELILSESQYVVRARPNLIIVKHRLGFVMANAGIDQSNIGADGHALLLPRDPDGSAALFGRTLMVSITGFADEIAAAAGLVMGQGAEGQPAVLLRGLSWSGAVNPAAELLRPAQEDLFQ